MPELDQSLQGHLLPPPGPEPLRAVLHELLFRHWTPEFLASEAGGKAMDDVVFGRFNKTIHRVIPWIRRHCDLGQARILEIGCGSGSSTAAFGLFCREIRGFDIDDQAIAAARARCAHFALDNVSLAACPPAELLAAGLAAYDRLQVVLLFAVLEHMTIPERLDYLARLWDRLEPGGLLVVVETPNRLTYADHHTSESAFLHLLPDELAFRCYRQSRRFAFVEAMDRALQVSAEAAHEARIRWGLGVSIHEFQAALAEDIAELVVADAWDDEIYGMFPLEDEEDLLTRFGLEKVPEQPPGFFRSTLSLILRKPRDAADRAQARAFSDARRDQLRRRFPPAPSLRRVAEDNEQLREELRIIKSSLSWRLTAPLRAVRRLTRKDRDEP